MIQMQTTLDVADNTGAKAVQCFKVLGGTKRRYAGIGDIIIGSVKKSIPTASITRSTSITSSAPASGWIAARIPSPARSSFVTVLLV